MARDPSEEASLEQVRQGGLPRSAEQRIAEARAAAGGFFTSTLTIPETLVARAAGYEPISQVMGVSIYHVGWSGVAWGMQSGENAVLTHAHYDARARALSRMHQEAQALG